MKRILLFVFLCVALFASLGAPSAFAGAPGGGSSSNPAAAYGIPSLRLEGINCSFVSECKRWGIKKLNPYTALLQQKMVYARMIRDGRQLAYPGASGKDLDRLRGDALHRLSKAYETARAYITSSKAFPGTLLDAPGRTREEARAEQARRFERDYKIYLVNTATTRFNKQVKPLLAGYTSSVKEAQSNWQTALRSYRRGKATLRQTRLASGDWLEATSAARSSYLDAAGKAKDEWDAASKAASQTAKDKADALRQTNKDLVTSETKTVVDLRQAIKNQIERLYNRGTSGPKAQGSFLSSSASALLPDWTELTIVPRISSSIPVKPVQAGCKGKPKYCQPL